MIYIKQVILIIFLVSSTISSACTPLRTALVTTEEAILGSESIVLATVLGQPVHSEDIIFTIDEVIYGKEITGVVRVRGHLVTKSQSNAGDIPYKKGRRKTAGLCNANDYELASTYLLMLKDKQFWSAYTPINEKINGKNDPWLMWVKGFVAGAKYKTKDE
jgi:hypothetical protein